MKRNAKLTLPVVLGVISLLAIVHLGITSVLTWRLRHKVRINHRHRKCRNKCNRKLDELAQKFRGLVNNSGANLSLPQDGNLSERLQTLVDSPQFKNLTQQLSQQMSQLGVNGSNIRNLARERRC